MDILVDTFQKEYKTLTAQYKELNSQLKGVSEKISAISKAIQSYGGTLPIEENEEVNNSNSHPIHLYPKNASWRDKIRFALNNINKEASATDIAEFIYQQEPIPDKKSNTFNMVTQYCSNMFKAGELISAGKHGKKNLYLIKKQ
jgi:hypothetical protein